MSVFSSNPLDVEDTLGLLQLIESFNATAESEEDVLKRGYCVVCDP